MRPDRDAKRRRRRSWAATVLKIEGGRIRLRLEAEKRVDANGKARDVVVYLPFERRNKAYTPGSKVVVSIEPLLDAKRLLERALHSLSGPEIAEAMGVDAARVREWYSAPDTVPRYALLVLNELIEHADLARRARQQGVPTPVFDPALPTLQEVVSTQAGPELEVSDGYSAGDGDLVETLNEIGARQVAAAVGVHVVNVVNWISKGRVPPEKRPALAALAERHERDAERLYACGHCGTKGMWGPTWSLIGTPADSDAGTAIPICTTKCREAFEAAACPSCNGIGWQWRRQKRYRCDACRGKGR